MKKKQRWTRARKAARTAGPYTLTPIRPTAKGYHSDTTDNSITAQASVTGQRMRGVGVEEVVQVETGVDSLAPKGVCNRRYNELRQALHDAKGTPQHAVLAQEYYSLLARPFAEVTQ